MRFQRESQLLCLEEAHLMWGGWHCAAKRLWASERRTKEKNRGRERMNIPARILVHDCTPEAAGRQSLPCSLNLRICCT